MQGRYEVSPRRSSGKPLTLRGVLCRNGTYSAEEAGGSSACGEGPGGGDSGVVGLRGLFYRVARRSPGLTDYYYEICLNPGTRACLASSPTIYLP